MDLQTVVQTEVRKTKTNIVHECIYVTSRKMVQANIFAGKEEGCRCRDEWTQGGKGEEGCVGRRKCRVHTSACKTSSCWGPVTKCTHLSSALCGGPEGWDEGLGGKSRREGIYVHI